MADPVVIYPEDFTGQAASNRIVGEQIIITAPGDRRYHTAMPRFAPMYEKGLKVFIRRLDGVVIELFPGIDFYMSHKFAEASLATMHPIYGSISFLRRDIVGTLIVNYQTLGGDWTIDEQKILEILADQTRNPRITAWEQVVNRPREFPVVDHPWNLDDMVGQKEILEILERFYLAFVASLDPEGGGGALAKHLADHDNPHKGTAAQVGAYTIQQVDALLTKYLLAQGIAVDSTRLGGKLLAEIMQDVVNVKVTNAGAADTALNATNATNANNSARLEGQTLQQIVDMINQSTGSNAIRFNGKTYEEVRADYMAGTAANAGKLGGKTLAEIMAEIQAASGDAKTLEGRNFQAIMDAVVLTKVNNAVRADIANDSQRLEGKSLGDILAQVTAIVPPNAENANKVYNLEFDELVERIMDSETYSNMLPFAVEQFRVEGIPVGTPNTGGTADNTYSYMWVADIPIPKVANTNVWDPTARIVGSELDFYLYQAATIRRARVTFATSGNKAATLKWACDDDLKDIAQFGIRVVPSTIVDSGGNPASTMQLYMRFKKTIPLRQYGVFQFNKNNVHIDNDNGGNATITDHTLLALNTVTWQDQVPTGGTDAALRVDTQAGFDGMATTINTLTADPAA